MAEERKLQQDLRQALVEQAVQLQYLQHRLSAFGRTLNAVYSRIVDALEYILDEYGLSFIDVTEASSAAFRRWIKEQGWQYNMDLEHPDVRLTLTLIEARELLDKMLEEFDDLDENAEGVES